MATFNKINSFVEAVAEKAHNLGSDSLVLALTNTAHTSTWTQLSDLTQVTYTNLSSRAVTITSSSQSGGTYDLVLQDLTLTSSGGSTGPFRYVYLYNDTSTTDLLIGYWDYGSSITLASGETFTADFGASGLMTIA